MATFCMIQHVLIKGQDEITRLVEFVDVSEVKEVFMEIIESQIYSNVGSRGFYVSQLSKCKFLSNSTQQVEVSTNLKVASDSFWAAQRRRDDDDGWKYLASVMQQVEVSACLNVTSQSS